ncbi:MAG: hypothetical protein AAFU83_03795, partial [Bacteroidota bacterium]
MPPEQDEGSLQKQHISTTNTIGISNSSTVVQRNLANNPMGPHMTPEQDEESLQAQPGSTTNTRPTSTSSMVEQASVDSNAWSKALREAFMLSQTSQAYTFTSTQELVRIWNNSQVTPEQLSLIAEYVEGYASYLQGLNLTQDTQRETLSKYLAGYKLLSQLQLDTQSRQNHKECLSNYFFTLYGQVYGANQDIGSLKQPLMEALVHVLQNIDTSIFLGDN